MPVLPSIATFLLKWVAPSIPDIVSTIATQRQSASRRGATTEERTAELERQCARQLALIDALTKQVESFRAALRLTLTIGVVALLLSLTGLVIMYAV